MASRYITFAVLLTIGSVAGAQSPQAFDAAAAFGTRESVIDLSLSPDGSTIAYVATTPGAGSAAYTLVLNASARPTPVMVGNGKPNRLRRCNWVSNDRLACEVFGVVDDAHEVLPFTREFAVNSDGTNQKQLSTQSNEFTRGVQLAGGHIVDLLPDQNGLVLMSRYYLPDDHTGSHLGSAEEGLGVDQLDTRTLAVKMIEPPNPKASHYISDGHGIVRVMGLNEYEGHSDQRSGARIFMYRPAGSREWLKLSPGFYPLAVDQHLNVAYGLRNQDGRDALYSVALDSSMHQELVFARPDVDVDELLSIGRRNRVVGVSFATDLRSTVYFDRDIADEVMAIQKALPPQTMIRIIDSSADERKLLLFASRDDNPGVFYQYDRQERRLRALLVSREELRSVKLAKVQPVTYHASDGTAVPAYLTLPPGSESAKGLPAIVMPHGGPGARDYWGFDWLAQYFAARGYVVIQPNYRGSAGYGDSWYKNNGFQSWPTAISDILDAGRWLVAEGMADPARLGIVGWSYGGYAALQSAVVDQSVFKAVIAIAPVTDLQQLKDDHANWDDKDVVSRFVGSGPHVREGSPARNADRIKVPVLMFQGTLDRNVTITHSRMMAKSLREAKAKYELVTWDGLDHQLDDSKARIEMLRKSDEFLRKAFGM